MTDATSRDANRGEPGVAGRHVADDGPAGLDWLVLFRALVEEADEVHTVVDREGRLLYVNRMAARIFGMSPEECLGRSAFDFVHPDDRQLTREGFLRWVVAPGDQPRRFENRQLGRDDEVRILSWTIHPVRDGRGEVHQLASTARDVTERRRYERALVSHGALQRALLDGMLDPVVTIDVYGQIQTASASVATVFGYEPEELVGQNVRVLMPEPHRSAHDGYLAHYRETGEAGIIGRTRPFQVVRKDGGLIDVELSVSRVDPQGQGGPVFIGSFRDVTERNRAQRSEISVLKALAALGESAATLAHEIKNPVTAVNMALRVAADTLGVEQEEVLRDLVARMQHLEQQLRQSLAFARALDLELELVPTRALFEFVQHTLDAVLAHGQVALEVDVDEKVARMRVDEMRIEEVLTNLVMNAVEMMPGGGRIVLSARPGPEGHVDILVADDGPGVPDSVRDTLFKPFITSKPAGTGLGLPICRRIVEEHGGSLELVDGELCGACFRVRLPGGQPEEQP